MFPSKLEHRNKPTVKHVQTNHANDDRRCTMGDPHHAKRSDNDEDDITSQRESRSKTSQITTVRHDEEDDESSNEMSTLVNITAIHIAEASAQDSSSFTKMNDSSSLSLSYANTDTVNDRFDHRLFDHEFTRKLIIQLRYWISLMKQAKQSLKRFVHVCILYCILSTFILCLLLLYTPFGHQGIHISNLPPAAARYAELELERYEQATTGDASLLAAHPSGSWSAAGLKTWRTIKPSEPSMDERVPILPRTRIPPIVGDATTRTTSLPSTSIFDPTKSTYDLGKFVIVSYGSSQLYDRVTNLIGSVNLWEPTQRIIIYDMGFTQTELEVLMCIKRLQLIPFNYTAYGDHVRSLWTFAFVPLLAYDALSHVDSILLIEPHYELRQQLHSVKSMLARDGYFASGGVHRDGALGHYTAPETAWQLGVDVADLFDANIPFCSDVIGFVRSAPVFEQVVVPAARCALKPSCLHPRSAAREYHALDQSVWSILLAKNGLSCSAPRLFAETDLTRCTLRLDRFIPFEEGGAVFCFRGGHGGHYVPYIDFSTSCQLYMVSPIDTRRYAPPRREFPSYWLYQSSVVTTARTSKRELVPIGSTLRCRAYDVIDRVNCQPTDRIKMWTTFKLNTSAIGTWIIIGLRLCRTYVLLLLLWYLFLLCSYGRVWVSKNVRLMTLVWILTMAIIYCSVRVT